MIFGKNSHMEETNLDKIGNIIIYLVDSIKKKYKQDLYLTKLLKLLYIIDETSVKETGAPVTCLNYKVWKMGPVAEEVYNDIAYKNSENLNFFIEGKKEVQHGLSDNLPIKIESVNKFDDSELSDYEVDLMDKVVAKFGHLTGQNLIDFLHEEGSLWKTLVNDYKLEESFKIKSKTNIDMDFARLLNGDPFKLSLFENSQHSFNL
jgi:uncharacterized phage-associated protein